MKNVQQPWFETQRIRDDLFCITEPLYTWENRANLWLVKGRDADLLIDTGQSFPEHYRSLQVTIYGMREFSLTDPDGHMLSLGQDEVESQQ